MTGLQSIIDTLPYVRDVVVPPGVYYIDESIILPKVHGNCRLRGYGVEVEGGQYPTFLRRDEGERDSCTGWTIEGFHFAGGKQAMDISQTRQLRLKDCRCSPSTRRGFGISFGLLTQLDNCVFLSQKQGVRIGYGESSDQSLSNCSTVRNCRFSGGGDQLLIDSCSNIVLDQCTFEGPTCERALTWDGHFTPVARNLAIRSCHWESKPTIAAMCFERLHAGSIVLDQPEIHPRGQIDTLWTSILGRNNRENLKMEIRMPTVFHGMMDTYGSNGKDGIRYIYFTSQAGNITSPSRWVGGKVGATFRDWSRE